MNYISAALVFSLKSLLIMMKKAQRHNLRLEKHWSVKRKWIEDKMKQFDFINKKMS